MERGDWESGAAALRSGPQFLHVMAITHFARAVGAARSGKPDAAKADIAKLAEFGDQLREAKDAYWAEQVDIQWQTANAWLLGADRANTTRRSPPWPLPRPPRTRPRNHR